MDRWPADDRNKLQGYTKTKSKSKDKGKDNSWAYPVVERGALSAATLHRERDRFEWTFLAEDSANCRLVSKGRPAQVFPATRRQPSYASGTSVLQQAEQGAQFLRTYYPDLDVPAEIVRDEIVQDVRTTRKLDRFDPFSADMIATFSSSRGSRENLPYLAFSMGESYRDLNISPLNFSRRDCSRLNASAKPVHTFATPIQQIRPSGVPFQSERQSIGPVLGIRTLASTTFLSIKASSSRPPVISAEEIVHLARSDVGDRRIVDMLVPASRRTLALVVNDTGAVYRCSAPHGDKFLQLLHPGTSPIGEDDDHVWGFAPCEDDEGCILMSSRSASRLDFRTQEGPMDLFFPSNPGECLTSIEGFGEDRITRVVTTQQISWIDERNTRKPVFGVKHARDHDRTLSSHTRFLSNHPVTFLTSRRNGLISVYDVSRSTDDLVHENSFAYSLPALHNPDTRNFGHVFLPNSTDAKNRNISVWQLAQFGDVYMLDLEVSPKDDIDHISHRSIPSEYEWSIDVQDMAEKMKSARIDLGPLAGRTFSEVDMRPIYNRLFRDENLGSSDNPDAVYDLLEKMPLFWQELDAPLENMVITYDIAYRSGSEPTDASRNDVFTETVLNSRRGYRALHQGRIPVQRLSRKAPWSLNIAPFLRQFTSDLDKDPEKMLENLRRYDLAPDDDRPAHSYRRESEAREQLLLDLSLSSDIFSPHHFQTSSIDPGSDDALETMSRAAEALSLDGSEPLPMQFGFLRPMPKADHYAKFSKMTDTDVKPSDVATLPLGARLLVREWEIGTDPHSYSYDDRYQDSRGRSAVPAPRRMKERSPHGAVHGQDQVIQPQRPPVIVPTAALAPPIVASSQPLAPRRPLVLGSQDMMILQQRPTMNGGSQPTEDWEVGASSQAQMPSTQVLPGPHGGRPGPAKKKPVRKRIGGF